jgi:hypothetical protein
MQLEKNTRTVDGVIKFGTVFIFLLISVIVLSNAASAADTSWVAPSSNAGGSGVTSPANAYADDTSYAVFNGGGTSNWNYYGYGFSSIPSGAMINGIEVNAFGFRSGSYGSNRYMRVRLSWDGGATWTSYNITTTEWASGSSPVNHILGGPADNWGHSWTRDEIVNNFRIQAQWMSTSSSTDASLDYIPVRVYYTAGAASTYNLSGYITNKSSGAFLSGANVSINTTPQTYDLTDASGFYYFSGLSNGTYIVNASMNGYSTNSTTTSISGADKTDINILLSPIPTYLLSGYVINASSGTAISGATVTTDTGLTTSTDGAGYYSFSVNNGTYIITATKAGYIDNSTTKTVNGAAVDNADIQLLPVPPVSTYLLSGYVTNTSGAAISGATVTTNTGLTISTDGAGYYSFSVNNGTYIITATKAGYRDNSTTKTVSGAAVSNANIMLAMIQTLQVQSSRYSIFSPWTGKPSDASLSANFTGYALLLGNNGLPFSGVNITFVISSPAGIKATRYSNTQANGLASVSYDTYSDFTTSTDTDYGNWTIKAYVTSDPTVADSTIMSIKAGGSGLSGGGCGNNYCHSTSTTSGGSPRSPYTDGYGSTTSRAAAAHKESRHSSAGCFVCHPGYAASITGLGHTGDVHKNRTCDYCHGDMAYISGTGNGIPKMPSCSDCHLRFNNNLTNISTLANLAGGNSVSVYSYNFDKKAPLAAHNGINYSLITSVPCIACHGPAHNNTKPDPNPTNTNNITEYTQCLTCHAANQRHNDTVSCTVCHSQDAHDIKVLAQNATYINDVNSPARGNCTNCHQNSTFFNILKSQPKAGSYTGRSPPQIPTPLNHSINTYAGALWNGTQPAYWDNKSQSSACNYCHGTVLHEASALGDINQIKGTNNLNQNLLGSSWCANCHYKNAPDYAGDHLSPQPPEVLNQNGLVPATSRDGTTFYNHSDALSTSSDDATCKACHNNNLAASATSLNFSHNIATGSAGGRDCVSCHDKGNSVEKVDVSKMNQSDSIHNFLNSNSVIVTPGLNPNNKRCWACHTNSSLGANNVVNEADLPASGHPNSYNVPKKCTQCHIQGNFSALVVSEHFSDSTEIRTKLYANTNDSCVNCHNKSEMLLPNSDPNGPKSIYASVSHYGSNKTNAALYVSGGSANCTYCHQNPANAFTTEMIDAAGNSSISNHTQLGTNPACINCHNSGRIHFATLTKPAVNSSLCINCHTNKDQHNGSVECSQCHTQSNRSIHPIQYLQPDGTFKINSPANKSTAVNCTNCHQGIGVTGFNNAPIIPDTLKHSASLSNGTIWGTYWTSEQGSCYYCHGNTKHNNTALGLINNLTLDSNNTKNGALQTTTWCADCHYSDAANTYYLGNQWSPVPPTITLNNTGKSGWENHTSYIAGGYKDEKCKSCHALNGAYGTTSLNYSHSLNVGVSGGADCISCHYVGSSYHNIDTVAANASVHSGMNSNNATSAGFAAIDGACWACHDTDGNVTNNPSNQIMGDIYNTPKKCDDCHLTSGAYYSQSASWGGPTVSEHYYNGSKIKAGNSNSDIESCINCHENVSEMIINNNDPDYGTFAGDGVRLTGGNMSFYHYGKPRNELRTWDSGKSENCSYCHQNTSTAFAIGMLNPGYNSSIQNHSQTQASPSCYNSTCHNSGWIHNSTLTRPALNPGSTATFCQNCHITKQTHNGTLDCSNCHINQSSSDTIHPIKFIQNTGTFDTSRAQAANCTNCHQGTGVSGFDVAPKVPEPVNHSTSLSAGQKWGNYWDNTSQITACYYCHQNEIHENNTGLFGNVSVIEGSNILNNPDLANSTWCANCHYAGAQNYKGNLLAVSPPEITNSSLVASDGTVFFNHSGLTNFNDSNCKNCHGLALAGYSETSLNLSHSISVGGGGDNCIECHGTNYIGATPSVTRTFVNISAFNESIHQDLNATPVADVNNLDCWSCHYNKDMNRQNVKKCGDCHRKPSQWHGNANITTNLSELW